MRKHVEQASVLYKHARAERSRVTQAGVLVARSAVVNLGDIKSSHESRCGVQVNPRDVAIFIFGTMSAVLILGSSLTRAKKC